jgi:hypothetical protein
MPTPPAQNPSFGGASQPLLEFVTLATHPIDAVEHPFQQRFGRGGGYAGPLKLPDFAALPMDLGAHPLNFGSDLIKLHDVLVRLKPFQSGDAQPPSDGLPAREGAGDSTT